MFAILVQIFFRTEVIRPVNTAVSSAWCRAPHTTPPPHSGDDRNRHFELQRVFFLLIYFLVTSFVQLAAAINAPASQSTVGRIAKGSDRPEGTTLTVRIDADDVVWIEQDAVFGHPEVYSRLKSSHDELGVDRLKIAASSEATHGTLVLVLDAGVAAKFTSAQLSIEEVQ